MLVDLPHELVREILLHAAQTSTSSCRTLYEVSTWVRKLALPILYTTVFLDHFTIEVFAHVVASSSLVCPPSPIFRPADAVRHIWVSPTMFVPLCTIIRHCKNATHFAFNRIGISALSSAMDPSVSISREEACVQGGDREEVEGALHVTLLNNGSHAGWELFDEDTMFRPHKPLSRRLRRVRFGRPIDLGYSLSIPHLPGLTHLAAPAMGVTENELNNIFDIFTGTSIEVFVLVLTRKQMDGGERRKIDDWVYKAHMKDERIHAVKPLFDDPQREWDVEVQGGVTIWERAVDYTQQLMSQARFTRNICA